MNETTSAFPLDEFLGLEKKERGDYGLSLDEAALIDRCVSGDETAFDQIVHRYQDMVYNMALRLLGTKEEALDLSQEVFFQVYRKLSTFRRDASLRTWIYRIVFNRAKNRQRWWRRREQEMTALDVQEHEAEISRQSNPLLGRYAPDPDRILERKEQRRLLRTAIAKLPFDQRTVLLLKEIEDFSYEEISETLGLALGTVKSRLARARKALRDQLAPELRGLG